MGSWKFDDPQMRKYAMQGTNTSIVSDELRQACIPGAAKNQTTCRPRHNVREMVDKIEGDLAARRGACDVRVFAKSTWAIVTVTTENGGGIKHRDWDRDSLQTAAWTKR